MKPISISGRRNSFPPALMLSGPEVCRFWRGRLYPFPLLSLPARTGSVAIAVAISSGGRESAKRESPAG
jgi:hypothetical protein